MGKGERSRRTEEPVNPEVPLARYLVSTEKRVRDRAIRSLTAYLLQCSDTEGLQMSDVELAKLWKGIFYCFWMSDKPLVQQALAQELADLVLAVAGIDAGAERQEAKKREEGSSESKENTSADGGEASASARAPSEARARSALDFYKGFWDTMHTEWMGLDKYRVNKYYLLMRRFVEAGFRVLVYFRWNGDVVRQYISTMRGTDGPLSSNNVRVPNSITYHVSDIFLDELEKVMATTEDPAPVPIVDILTPCVELVATSQSKQVYDRMMEGSILPFLEDCKKAQSDADTERKQKRRKVENHDEDQDEDEDELRFPTVLAHMHCASTDDEDEEDVIELVNHELRRKIFTVASGNDTYAPSRRKLYELWKSEQEDEL